MEPETSTPQLGPEQAPIQYRPNIERAPVLPTPERGIETGAERREQAAEPTVVSASNVGLPTILPLPILADVPVVDPIAVSQTPIIAGDDDLIEKEWVEKAKKIVAETRDNPYGREQAVSQLQKDYLMKRYGRELGAA